MANVLNLVEVAEYLRVHPTTIYRLIKKREIPVFKVGSDYRFNQESIDRWRLNGEENTTARPIEISRGPRNNP